MYICVCVAVELPKNMLAKLQSINIHILCLYYTNVVYQLIYAERSVFSLHMQSNRWLKKVFHCVAATKQRKSNVGRFFYRGNSQMKNT